MRTEDSRHPFFRRQKQKRRSHKNEFFIWKLDGKHVVSLLVLRGERRESGDEHGILRGVDRIILPLPLPFFASPLFSCWK